MMKSTVSGHCLVGGQEPSEAWIIPMHPELKDELWRKLGDAVRKAA
jgi:hypothetical protein